MPAKFRAVSPRLGASKWQTIRHQVFPPALPPDNPTSGLHPLSTGTVESSLQELKRECTIVLVPHSVQQAARMADRAAFLLDGELVEVDTATRIFTGPADRRTEDYVTGRFG